MTDSIENEKNNDPRILKDGMVDYAINNLGARLTEVKPLEDNTQPLKEEVAGQDQFVGTKGERYDSEGNVILEGEDDK